jgi:hypothetical protein
VRRGRRAEHDEVELAGPGEQLVGRRHDAGARMQAPRLGRTIRVAGDDQVERVVGVRADEGGVEDAAGGAEAHDAGADRHQSTCERKR